WQLLMGIVGVGVLCVMGIQMFIKKPRPRASLPSGSIQNIHHYVTFFFKGFLVNLTNPTIIFYWLTLTGVTISTYGFMTDDYYLFFTVLFVVSILLDLTKVFAISHYRSYLRFNLIHMLNRFLGCVLVVIGLFFCVRSMILS
ncbi:MAG: hypothetical protein EHM72_15555, partial [Calditrichaeota bacterium]